MGSWNSVTIGRTKPTLANTGAASATRTDLPALTVVSGDPTIVSGTSGNPTIIRDKDFTGGIGGVICHDVTFINCRFRNDNTTDEVVQIGDSTPANMSVKFIDCTIAQGVPKGTHGIGLSNGVQFIRCLVYNCDHPVHTMGGNTLIDSCILDPRASTDNVAGVHSNAFYQGDGPNSGIIVRNTVLHGGNSYCVFSDIAGGNGITITNVLFDGCWFYGGSTSSSTSSAFGGSSSSRSGWMVVDSRFQNGNGLDGIAVNPGGFTTWSNAQYDDGSGPVPQP